ncbi:MAG: ribonuclease HII [Candidatus Uhrbacteria bacterium]
MKKDPTFHFERDLAALGYRAVVGVDEVGCGALAGPVVAGAVILQPPFRLAGVRDSKLLSATARERLAETIKKQAQAQVVGEASVEEINQFGIRQATFLAMRRAIEKIGEVDFVLVDAWQIPGLPFKQKGIIRGDRLIKSIAAASIIAKVYRDAFMRKISEEYSEYGFDEHKGYATAFHLSAIEKHGPCPIHRTSWRRFQPQLFD